jgi:hypothetical protein
MELLARFATESVALTIRQIGAKVHCGDCFHGPALYTVEFL